MQFSALRVGSFPYLLILAASCGKAAPLWQCVNHGLGRLCSRELVAPEGEGWDCYVADGTLACTSEGEARRGGRGWSCASALGRTVCLAVDTIRPPEPSPDGWQCHIAYGRILCSWRLEGNGPWLCSGTRCRQLFPDYPSANEWECVEEKWGVLCRGRFIDGVLPRWRCSPYEERSKLETTATKAKVLAGGGPATTTAAGGGKRFLCFDPDPDYPHPHEDGDWKCRYDNSRRTGRHCEAVAPVKMAAAKTPSTNKRDVALTRCTGCPGVCSAGRCFPASVQPFCFFDTDCRDGGKCLLGTCVTK